MWVACCQFDIAWEDKPANFAKVRALLAGAKLRRGTLVALPEMSFTGFSMDVARLAEPAGGESERFLRDTAREFGVWLVGGVAGVDQEGRARNQLIVFSPEGAEVKRYAKMQPFTPGKEAQHYIAGDSVMTFRAGEILVAPFICYDLRFPELFRMAAWQKPGLFVVIANWPEARIAHWVKLLQARAIENQAYVIGVNRCGSDPELRYNGRSLIANPHGEIIADAGDGEGVLTAEIDFVSLEDYRRNLPFLGDMRSDFVKKP
jgi:omega-amidase